MILKNTGQALRSILELVFLEIRRKSLNTAIGWLWSLVNPLVQISIIFFITTVVFKSERPNLIIWLLTTMSTWVAIQASVIKASNTAISRRALIQNTSISIKKLVLVETLVELAVLAPFYLVGIALLILQGDEKWRIVFVLPALLVIVAFTYFTGLIFACLTPWFRDVPYILGLGLQVVFWISPIVYSRYELTGILRTLMDWNPITYILEATQFVFQGNAWTYTSIAIPVVICLILYFVSNLFANIVFPKSVVLL